MDAAAVIANATRVQEAFNVISTLMFTAYLFPQQTQIKDLEEYDIIVVGAGSAGSVVADRLSECPDLNVLVIEAGDNPPLESMIPSTYPYLTNPKYSWNFKSVLEKNLGNSRKTKELNIVCGRMLGGGSSINYMQYMRGCPNDYDIWAELAKDDTWKYEKILPYFIKKVNERLEDEEILRSRYKKYHGNTGFLGITKENRPIIHEYLQAFRELGHDILLDINGEKSLGYFPPLYTIADGQRQTTAYTNLGRSKYRQNLHVLKKTTVTEILFDKKNNAFGVKALNDQNKINTIKAKLEVIVCAGAINTAKLLMLSGIGPKEHLQNLGIKVRSNLPVGQNFRDHHALPLYFKMNKGHQEYPSVNYPYLFPLPVVTGLATLNRAKTCPDYQTFNLLAPRDDVIPTQICSNFVGYKDYLCQKLYEASRDRSGMFTLMGLLHPKSKGQVTLASRNPLDPPKIFTGMFTNEKDLEDYASYVEDFIRVVNTTYFRNSESEILDFKIQECIDFQFGSRCYWKCYVKNMATSFVHYVGTAALGTVVDSNLRVLNVNRLRVADASVMPRQVSGNPNAVVIMIGERLADFVKTEYGK